MKQSAFYVIPIIIVVVIRTVLHARKLAGSLGKNYVLMPLYIMIISFGLFLFTPNDIVITISVLIFVASTIAFVIFGIVNIAFKIRFVIKNRKKKE